MTRLQPQHDAPTCAHCQCQTVTPLDLRCSLRGFQCSDLRALWCPACGHRYTEAGDQRVARAWWSAGAYAGAEDVREREVGGARKAAFAEAAEHLTGLCDRARDEVKHAERRGDVTTAASERGALAAMAKVAAWCRERSS